MGEGRQKSETSKQAPARRTKAAVDRRQNNRMLRQCPSDIAQRPPHYAIAVPTVMQNRVTMSVAPPLGNSCSKRSPALFLAQHHLPALDLFWASFFVRVQFTSLLLISPGLVNKLSLLSHVERLKLPSADSLHSCSRP